ncbi:MAG: hypothetical protein ABWW69_04900 [Pyrodictiaceae archaeon]
MTYWLAPWIWKGGWRWGWRGPWPGNGPWSFLPPWLRPGWHLGRGYCRLLYGPGAGWWLRYIGWWPLGYWRPYYYYYPPPVWYYPW